MGDEATPMFSVIVPTYRRPRQLRACLTALASLNYPRDRLEIIVVDDGGGLRSALPDGRLSRYLCVRVLTQENAGPAKARNTGAAAACGEFLAFTDDDCAPDALWLRSLASRLLQNPEAIVGGQTVNALPRNPFSTASQVLISYLYRYYNADPEQSRFMTSNNMSVSAKAFADAGGFDTTYPRPAAEDREFCDRWLHLGRRLIYETSAIVYHAHELNLHTFLVQHFQYGCGARRFHQVRARRQAQPISLEPASFYANLIRTAFIEQEGWEALRLAALLTLSQLSGAAGFYYQRLKAGFER